MSDGALFRASSVYGSVLLFKLVTLQLILLAPMFSCMFGHCSRIQLLEDCNLLDVTMHACVRDGKLLQQLLPKNTTPQFQAPLRFAATDNHSSGSLAVSGKTSIPRPKIQFFRHAKQDCCVVFVLGYLSRA